MSFLMDQTRALTLVRSVFRRHVSAASHADTMADDEQQIREALERHEWDVALTALMDAYGRRVYLYCFRMLKDADLAEDALQ